jgi:predicted SprT family Zn-dependent metalloprotease
MTKHNESYITIEKAYQHFNKHLWGGKLPPCLITYTRHRRAYGYFSPNRMITVDSKSIAHEIALNPLHFKTRPLHEVLSTLVHEMAHLWQQERGNFAGNYHNREWGSEMKRIGLYPSDTGRKGGKETGRNMSHYIIEGGLFEVSYDALKHKVILYQDRAETSAEKKVRRNKAASKTKYTCPHCEVNAWAKPNAPLMCGECECNMVTEDDI